MREKVWEKVRRYLNAGYPIKSPRLISRMIRTWKYRGIYSCFNAIAMSIVEKYKDVPGDQLLPFISSQNYNENIKTILEKAGITYLVTKLDSVTARSTST